MRGVARAAGAVAAAILALEGIAVLFVPRAIAPTAAGFAAAIEAGGNTGFTPDGVAPDLSADAVVAEVERHAPGFAESVAHRYVQTPRDLADELGLIVGNIVQPGSGLNIDPATLDGAAVADYAAKAHDSTLIGFLQGIIPATVVGAFADGNILQVLFVAILFGVGLILQQVARDIFGAPAVNVVAPVWLSGGVDILGAVVPKTRIFILVLAVVSVLALSFALKATPLGRRIRAVVANRDLAETVGISSRRTDISTFFIGSGLAGVAGVALTLIGSTSSTVGQSYLIDAFLVVVIGGLGQIRGTVIAAFAPPRRVRHPLEPGKEGQRLARAVADLHHLPQPAALAARPAGYRVFAAWIEPAASSARTRGSQPTIASR